jgi:hypothetical protein
MKLLFVALQKNGLDFFINQQAFLRKDEGKKGRLHPGCGTTTNSQSCALLGSNTQD